MSFVTSLETKELTDAFTNIKNECWRIEKHQMFAFVILIIFAFLFVGYTEYEIQTKLVFIASCFSGALGGGIVMAIK